MKRKKYLWRLSRWHQGLQWQCSPRNWRGLDYSKGLFGSRILTNPPAKSNIWWWIRRVPRTETEVVFGATLDWLWEWHSVSLTFCPTKVVRPLPSLLQHTPYNYILLFISIWYCDNAPEKHFWQREKRSSLLLDRFRRRNYCASSQSTKESGNQLGAGWKSQVWTFVEAALKAEGVSKGGPKTASKAQDRWTSVRHFFWKIMFHFN